MQASLGETNTESKGDKGLTKPSSQQQDVKAKKKRKKKESTGPLVYPEVHDRVRDAEGYYGHVRYVGPVCTAKNPYFNYVGVEWDVAGRGKHDGAVKTEQGYERYFDCEMGKGSFVKPNKLVRCTTFLTAMKSLRAWWARGGGHFQSRHFER